MGSYVSQLYRAGAIASAISAVTTAVLVYGPDVAPVDGAIAQAQLHSNWMYLYKKWVLFFHPQFSLLACIAAGFVLFRNSPVLVTFGLFYLLVWAVTEMAQQAFVIDGLNQIWRPGYLGADASEVRAQYATLLAGFSGISDSLYFLLIFCFGVGSICLGLAFVSSETLLAKIIGACQLAIGSLSLISFAGYYMGATATVPVSNWVYQNLYGVLQTGVRIAIAMWLWKCWTQGSRESAEVSPN